MTAFARLLSVVLLALAALSALGCSVSKIAGAGDVELTYEMHADPVPAAFGEDVRARVLQRLSAAQIGADVVEEGRSVRVVVDEELATAADNLVTWSGTLALHAPTPSYDVSMHEGPGLTVRAEPLPDGGVDRHYVGSRAAVTRAAQQLSVDRQHLVVAEPIWSSSKTASPPLWRTRIVAKEPLGELGDGVLVSWSEGGALRLRAQPKTAGAEAIGAAHRRAKAGALPEILVRGKTSLGAPSVEADALIVTFGEGPAAYARAQDERRLLTTPRLPMLRRTGAEGLPPNTRLAAACFVLPVLLSLGWLAFVRRFDRAHPEPMWLVLVTFLLGAAATIPAALVELALVRISPWLDPRLVSFGGQLFALPLSFVVLTVVVGATEEGAKLLGTAFAARRPEFDEPVDGIVYGIVSSLGFAAAENIEYFTMVRLAAPTVIARTFMSVPAHMFFGAIWGYALGAYLVDRNRARVVRFALLAAAAHGLFDALLGTDGTALLAVLLNVVLASVFVALIRRALRHGVVSQESARIPDAERLFVRVGRPNAFTFAAVSVHVLAAGIFMLGAWYQLTRHRTSLTFVVGSSVMLALLGVAAYGVAATVPLDVAIDDHGVTFAGATRPWKSVRGFEVRGDKVVLECEGGPILLGPGSPSAVERIAAALSARLARG
jgi:protease PrsW